MSLQKRSQKAKGLWQNWKKHLKVQWRIDYQYSACAGPKTGTLSSNLQGELCMLRISLGLFAITCILTNTKIYHLA